MHKDPYYKDLLHLAPFPDPALEISPWPGKASLIAHPSRPQRAFRLKYGYQPR